MNPLQKFLWAIFFGCANLGFLRVVTDLCPHGAVYARIGVATILTFLLAALMPVAKVLIKEALK